jgi:hypothetical protein
MTKIFDVPDGLEGINLGADPYENRESIRRVFNYFYDLSSGGQIDINQNGGYEVSEGVFDLRQKAGRIGFAVRSLFEPINPEVYGDVGSISTNDFWAGLLYDEKRDLVRVISPQVNGETKQPAEEFLVKAALACEASGVAFNLIATRLAKPPTTEELLPDVVRFLEETEE